MIERNLKVFLAAVVLALAGAASPATAQERPAGCVIESWPAFLDPGPQAFQTREKLATGSGEIVAIEFGPLAGEYGKLYLFMLIKDGCERKVFSVGSYDYLTEIARQNGEIGPQTRRYHLDMFEPEKRNTLEFRSEAPSYEEMREMALTLLR
jgi:hypothetical protein